MSRMGQVKAKFLRSCSMLAYHSQPHKACGPSVKACTACLKLMSEEHIEGALGHRIHLLLQTCTQRRRPALNTGEQQLVCKKGSLNLPLLK